MMKSRQVGFEMSYLVVNKVKNRTLACLVLVGIALSACTPAPTTVGFADPYEATNRKTHNFNRALDRNLVRPVANAYGKTTPNPVRRGVSNFTSNLSLPGTVLNDLLQFQIEDAGANTFRFLINSTFGFAGLLDVATDAGIAHDPSDFGETLHVWGIREGTYIELPFLGPSTTRETVGRVVDLLANPLNFVVDGQDRVGVAGATVLSRLGDRYQHRDLIDSVLYESVDSYSQARLLYLQNRRFRLGGAEQPNYSDPYEDVYGTE
ncbi:VacJ family lipoprotein [Litoreibacter sp.]|nr:VacJ family lipoprotein [Litoreibacter sp.]